MAYGVEKKFIMQYALSDMGVKVLPEKGKTALCPECEKEVIAKCGNINTWHWSHKNLLDCKYFERNETEWHRNWKSRFPEINREVRFTEYDKDGNKIFHIADVYLEGLSLAIEFQHSRISIEECNQRNEFYADNDGLGNGMIDWIIDISDSNYKFTKDAQHQEANSTYDIKKEKYLREEVDRLNKIKELTELVSDFSGLDLIKKQILPRLNEMRNIYSEYLNERYFYRKINEVVLFSKKDLVLNMYESMSSSRRIHCYLDTGKGNIAMIRNVSNFGSYLLIEVTELSKYNEYAQNLISADESIP